MINKFTYKPKGQHWVMQDDAGPICPVCTSGLFENRDRVCDACALRVHSACSFTVWSGTGLDYAYQGTRCLACRLKD